jgi:RNA polymerase subunit RPABC4/transcription elongation factor Spt4
VKTSQMVSWAMNFSQRSGPPGGIISRMTLLNDIGLLALLLGMVAGLLWIMAHIIGDAKDNERHKRAEVRQCIDCGYDLRQSTDQCPECGAFQPYCVGCGNRIFRDGDEKCPRCGRKARFLSRPSGTQTPIAHQH